MNTSLIYWCYWFPWIPPILVAMVTDLSNFYEFFQSTRVKFLLYCRKIKGKGTVVCSSNLMTFPVYHLSLIGFLATALLPWCFEYNIIKAMILLKKALELKEIILNYSNTPFSLNIYGSNEGYLYCCP